MNSLRFRRISSVLWANEPVRILLVATVLLAATAETRAATVFHYDGVGGNYNQTSPNINLPAVAHPNGSNDYIYAYSSTASISPVASYTGPAFYGGAWVTSEDGSLTGLSSARVRTGYTNNLGVAYKSQIELSMTGHSAVTSGASFVAFAKSEFSGGASSYTLDSTSSLSLTLSNGSQSVVRFALLSGNQWYLSSATTTPVANVGSTLTLSGQALLDSTWALWDPTGGANGRLGDVPSSFSVTGSSLGAIDAVGYYTSYNSSKNNQYAYLGDFRADLTAVPEPSTYALVLLSGVGLMVMLKKRRASVLAGK